MVFDLPCPLLPTRRMTACSACLLLLRASVSYAVRGIASPCDVDDEHLESPLWREISESSAGALGSRRDIADRAEAFVPSKTVTPMPAFTRSSHCPFESLSLE
jgi:hypothetical protein